MPPKQRTELATQPAAERAEHEAETERLQTRNRELEETDAVLGKAIGPLHQMNEQEPDAPQPTSGRNGSSTSTTPSSER